MQVLPIDTAVPPALALGPRPPATQARATVGASRHGRPTAAGRPVRDREAMLRVLHAHVTWYVARKVARLLDEAPAPLLSASRGARREGAGASERMADAVRWTLPILQPAERVEVLAGPRASLPPSAFADVLALAASFLGEADGRALRAAFCSGVRERAGWPS